MPRAWKQPFTAIRGKEEFRNCFPHKIKTWFWKKDQKKNNL